MNRPGGVASSPQSEPFVGTAMAAKSSGTLAVNVNGVIRDIQAARDVTFAAGDVVVVQRFGQLWVATARLFTAALTEMPPIIADLDPNPATITGQTTVLPVFTGTWLGSSWRAGEDLVRQGVRGGAANATGAVLYGDKPRSLTGATVTAARLEQVQWLDGPLGVASTMRLVTEATKPAGAPTLTSSTAGPISSDSEPRSFTIPTAWAQAMVDGTSGGIGFFDGDGSPFQQYAGRQYRPASFTLVIDWTR